MHHLASLAPWLIDLWTLFLGLIITPILIHAVCRIAVWAICRLRAKSISKSLRRLCILPSLLAAILFAYAYTIGLQRMEIKRITLYVDHLPETFDGYRIVQFSDIHLGNYHAWRKHLPQRDIDSINALHPDLICFTGDLQNAHPRHLSPYPTLLSSLKAKDGVYSIMGNHDYAWYQPDTPEREDRAIGQTMNFERRLGWHLLLNSHAVIHRGQDSIFIAGTENYVRPARIDIRKTLHDIPQTSFTLLLTHNPTAWDSIIATSHRKQYAIPQLTLAGHTHAGQISILGLRPTLRTSHDYGLDSIAGRYIYTSSGLGGVVPIRLGAWAEIVEITLKRR